ncbi:hypothetical protein CC2G_011576 [Coprinopsis cinerea AmutBmut pab1-1]|nr:hypothetical protein CC2G_011576 [Coprinopsis cinerea AmutBmut pab1-1]
MSTSTPHNDTDKTSNTLFEAPNSAEVQPVRDRKHFSIDLSLELERQLEMDSLPVTPMRDLTSATEDNEQKHEALDPEILAHLVMQLRHSLSEMTKERDELARMLADSHSKQASLNDALQLMTEKATTVNEELVEARRKNKEDEEAITLLRAKVEESRRGLMRLQTENRRQTMAPIDVNRASLLGSPPSSSNKRASFTPLTGRSAGGHRRISSVSDVAFSIADFHPSPSGQTLTFPDTGHNPQTTPPPSSTRYPAVFGRQSPPATSEGGSLELEEVKRELRQLKEELATAKHELAEANEAKEASETCVKALRQFIAENTFTDAQSSTASSSIKLPPLPTMATGEEAATESKQGRTATGWGFKLWGADSPRVPQSATIPPQSAPAVNGSPQLGGGATPTLPAAPLSRKFGGLFSSRSSISSTMSNNTPLPPLQTNGPSVMQRNPSHETSSSDASSVAEPISPSDDIHGLGTAPVVIRRDSTSLSDVGSVHGVVPAKSLDVEIIR